MVQRYIPEVGPHSIKVHIPKALKEVKVHRSKALKEVFTQIKHTCIHTYVYCTSGNSGIVTEISLLKILMFKTNTSNVAMCKNPPPCGINPLYSITQDTPVGSR